MGTSPMLRTTLRSLFAHKLRLALSTIAVVLGVAFVSGSLIFTDTLQRTFTDLFEGTAADVTVVPKSALNERTIGGGRGAAPVLTLSDNVIQTVSAIPGVAKVEGVVSTEGVYPLSSSGEAITSGGGAPGLGVNWSGTPGISAARIVEGRAPSAATDVVVDTNTFEKGKFAVGQTIGVVLPKGSGTFRLVGVFKFGQTGGLAGASVTAFAPTAAQELLLRPSAWNQVKIAVASGFSDVQVRNSVSRVLGPKFTVVTKQQQVAKASKELQDALSFFNYFLLGFAAIALFVGTFLIFNTFSMLVAQRLREFALLRAVGASRGQVTSSVLAEAALVGAAGAISGVVLGVALGFGLKALFGSLGLVLSAALVVSPRTILVALVLGVVVTVTAAYLPARRGSKIPPVAALRDAAVTVERSTRVRNIIGVILTIGGMSLIGAGLSVESSDQRALLVGIGGQTLLVSAVMLSPLLVTVLGRTLGRALPRYAGVDGRIAQENALRNPRRTAATASALLIGMTLVSLIAIVSSSTKASVNAIVDKTIGADIVVTTRSFQPFDPTFSPRITAVPGVADVVRQVSASAGVDGTTAVSTFIGGDLSAVYEVSAVAGDVRSLLRGEALVTQDRASTKRESVGDTIRVTYANGGTDEVRIGAIIKPNIAFGTNLLLPLSSYEKVMGQTADQLLYVNVTQGANASTVKSDIEAITKGNPLVVVWNQAELKQQQNKQFDQLLGIIYGLLGLSVVIAILGVVNTLVLSVSERTREIGLLRAVGSSRRGLRRMIRLESVFISLCGTLLGVGLGLAVGTALQRALAPSGITELVIPWATIGLFLVASVVVGVLAAVGPARRAARLDVLKAIATE